MTLSAFFAKLWPFKKRQRLLMGAEQTEIQYRAYCKARDAGLQEFQDLLDSGVPSEEASNLAMLYCSEYFDWLMLRRKVPPTSYIEQGATKACHARRESLSQSFQHFTKLI